MATTKQKVKVLPRRAVVLDGHLRQAGEVVSVTASDPKTLIAEGYAEKA